MIHSKDFFFFYKARNSKEIGPLLCDIQSCDIVHHTHHIAFGFALQSVFQI